MTEGYAMRPYRHLFIVASFLILSFSLTLAGCSTKSSSPRTAKTALKKSVALPKSSPDDGIAEEKPSPPVNITKSPQVSPIEPAELPDIPLGGPLPKAKIVIRKLERKLYLYSEGKLVREYPIKLGKNPVDDKVRQGDFCTPEGSFYICIKNPRSQYHLSLGLSYPNTEDAKRGLETKLIDKIQYDAIIRRISSKGIPPWDTPLGGEIFIHGEADIWDWTYGCVALYNDDIEELFKVVPVGTQVVIQK